MTNPKFDILNPLFTINNDKEKISVSAKHGNFLSENLILLKNNVFFESENFQIESDEVIFNRKQQIANSDENSIFKSEGTEINSEGYRMLNKRDIILFNGKTSLLLDK